MKLDKIKKEIEELRGQIRYADYRYYALSDPEISDKEYDSLLKKLESLEKEYPQFITEDSPTQRIFAGMLEGFSTVRHKKRMLSLDNTYSIEELKNWEEKIRRMLKRNVEIDYFAELKMDGISAVLVYEDAKLILGATRGDGERGENVTTNLKTIKSISLRLTGKNIPRLIEIRGEVYIGKKDFKKLNKERLKRGESSFVNPRNAAAGSLKLLNPALTAKRNLKYIVHSLGFLENYNLFSQKEFLEKVKEWGFCLNPCGKYCKNLEEVIDYCRYWQDKRDSLDYEVDGVVVKVNSFALEEELGATSKSPRWATSYKFPAHQATTKMVKAEFSVGRTGIITPVAILKPIKCGGVTISRATLHNFDEIQRLGVKESDTILIERAGEVIPKIVKVIISKRTGKEKEVKIPSHCPACGENTAKEKEEVYLYCVNPDCPAQISRSLIHFASRDAMDIKGLGKSVVEELVNRKKVNKLVDIYKLKKEDLLDFPLFKEKKADNLIFAIEKSKKRPLSRFLYGLGIKHVGEKAALILAKKFKSIEVFSRLKKDELEKIPEIGPVMAFSITRFFSLPKIKKMIEKFKKIGVDSIQSEKEVKKSRITGKIFVFTGELENFDRGQARKLVEELGGKWAASVSRNTDFIVAGKNPGSKYGKAKQLGIVILDEKSFQKLIE